MDTVGQAVAEFRALLESTGLRDALGSLNARTRHRFTGLYRLDAPMLRAICVFDRENPTLSVGSDTPMRETYCSLVGELGEPVLISDAASDERIAAHPARESILAYCGVPVRLTGGECGGTLCHFDVRPRIAHAADVVLLEEAASYLAPYVARAAASNHARA